MPKAVHILIEPDLAASVAVFFHCR
jgi:hypothetical protein